MTTITNVSHVTKVDGTTEELRGYGEVKLDTGFVAWIWSDNVVVMPMHQIKELVATEERSE